jgi:von Hippel-Lindau disease tumor supressor
MGWSLVRRCVRASAFVSAQLSSAACYAGVILTPLNPVLVDTTYQSISGTDFARIEFIDATPFAVDIYWIDYSGNRVFYNSLSAGTFYFQDTFLTHPWLVVESGTGGTTAQGTGTLIAAFLPVTAVGTTRDFDIAIITVPEPGSLALLGVALMCCVLTCGFDRGRRRHL